MNYYPHHIGDYLRDTAHLSALEDGIYRRMLDLYYSSEKPLPLNIEGLCRLVRAKSKQEREAVDTILEEFFTRSDDGWRQARADAEVAKAQEKSGKAKASAAQRWKCDGDANAMRTHMRTHSEGNARSDAPNNQYPITNNQNKDKGTGRKRPSVSMPEGFSISDRVRQWANGKGFDRLEAHLEHFVGWAKARGRTYSDWDQAFMNAVRDDWAGVRKNAAPDYSQVIANLKD